MGRRSHLARRELIIAMEETLKRIPPFRIAEGADAAIKPIGLYSAPYLPLVWA